MEEHTDNGTGRYQLHPVCIRVTFCKDLLKSAPFPNLSEKKNKYVDNYLYFYNSSQFHILTKTFIDKKISRTGNLTPISLMTGGHTEYDTIEDAIKR